MIVVQVECLVEHVGERCCQFLVQQRALEIASPSDDLKAIAAAVIGQISINLDDISVMVHTGDNTNPTTEHAAFAKIISGTNALSLHPLLRANATQQYSPRIFRYGKICMQICFNSEMNQPTQVQFGETMANFPRPRGSPFSIRTHSSTWYAEHW